MRIPSTPDDAADIDVRGDLTPTIGALMRATEGLDGYGGIWVDQAAGGVIHVGVSGTWSDETVHRLQSLVPASQELVLTDVAVSLSDLQALQDRLTHAVLSDPLLRAHLVTLSLEEQHNTVRLTMLTDTPRDVLDRVVEEFGSRGLVVDSASTGFTEQRAAT